MENGAPLRFESVCEFAWYPEWGEKPVAVNEFAGLPAEVRSAILRQHARKNPYAAPRVVQYSPTLEEPGYLASADWCSVHTVSEWHPKSE